MSEVWRHSPGLGIVPVLAAVTRSWYSSPLIICLTTASGSLQLRTKVQGSDCAVLEDIPIIMHVLMALACVCLHHCMVPKAWDR